MPPLAYSVAVAVRAPVSVEVDARAAATLLRTLGAGMRDPSPVVDGLARSLRQSIRTQFAVGGNPAWVPNRPNTIAAKGHSKPLHRSRGSSLNSSGIERSTTVQVVQVARSYRVEVKTSPLGSWHHFGRGEPVGRRGWRIAARRPGGMLRFAVVGKAGAFATRRTRAEASGPGKRRARERFSLGKTTVFVHAVWHPGYAARPFLPAIDDAYIQRHWRTPLGTYLFGHGLPRRAS